MTGLIRAIVYNLIDYNYRKAKKYRATCDDIKKTHIGNNASCQQPKFKDNFHGLTFIQYENFLSKGNISLHFKRWFEVKFKLNVQGPPFQCCFL